jgi:hypothetical protein
MNTTIASGSTFARFVALLLCAWFWSKTDSISATPSHSTYKGVIGKDQVAVVLEFCADGTVEGAYAIEDEYNLENRDPFPLRRLKGTNPRNGEVVLDVTLRGQSAGKISLTKRIHKGDVGRGQEQLIVWAGSLESQSGTTNVRIERPNSPLFTFPCRAFINLIDDKTYQAWMCDESMINYLKKCWRLHEIAKSTDGFQFLRTNILSEYLVPIPYAWRIDWHDPLWNKLTYDGRVESVSSTEIGIVVDYESGFDQSGGDTEGAIDSTKRSSVLTVPWNHERDGNFAVPKGVFVAVRLSKDGKIVSISFRGVFIDEKVRLNERGQVELFGRMWRDSPKPKPLTESGCVIRPRWWNGSHCDSVNPIEGYLGWEAATGYNLGPRSAGEGGIAMEALSKASTGPESVVSQPRGTPWIESKGWFKFSDSEVNPVWMRGIPEGSRDIKGVHPLKDHPEFYIPWNLLMSMPG